MAEDVDEGGQAVVGGEAAHLGEQAIQAPRAAGAFPRPLSSGGPLRCLALRTTHDRPKRGLSCWKSGYG